MRKIAAIGLVLLVYNLIFFPFHVPEPGQVSFLVFEVVVLAAMWLTFWPVKWLRSTKYAAITSGVVLIGTVLGLFEVNPVSNFFLWATSLFLTLVTLYLLLLKEQQFGSVAEIVFLPFRVLVSWGDRFFHQSEQWGIVKSKTRFNDTTVRVIRGAVIAVPLVLITVGLLSSADPIFGKLVNNIVKLPENLFARIFNTVLLLVCLVPLTAASIRHVFVSPANSSSLRKYPVEMLTIVALLATILGAFLVIQFRYLFATVPETELHQFGIQTYSEYVRRGFIEMIMVTCIVYFVAAMGYVIHRSNQNSKLKILNLVLLAEVGLFIASIFRRVYLYQVAHGLTRIRIYGSVFVVFLFGLVVFLALRYLIRTKRSWYLFEFGLGLVLIFATALIRPDAIIANWFPPTVNHEIDYVHLSRLSIDALPAWVKAYEHSQSVMAHSPNPAATPSAEAVRPVIYAYDATMALTGHYRHLLAKYGTKEQFVKFDGGNDAEAEEVYKQYQKRIWLERNLGEQMAFEKLIMVINQDELKKLESDMFRYMEKLPPDSRYAPLDRSYDSPLL